MFVKKKKSIRSTARKTGACKKARKKKKLLRTRFLLFIGKKFIFLGRVCVWKPIL